MTTIADVKDAIEQLDARQREEFFRWLTHRQDFQQQTLQDLKRDIAEGINQAERGDLAPLNMESVRQRVKDHLASVKK